MGKLYAQLDEWNAKIAERLAEQEGTHEAWSAAARARTQVEESNSAVSGEAAAAQEFASSPELKALYREVAKQVHSDLATAEVDRHKREQLMADANAAYQRAGSHGHRNRCDCLVQDRGPESTVHATAPVLI